MLRGKDPSWKTWILWISWLDKYEVKKLLQVRISTFLEKGPKFNKAYRMWIFPWIKLSWHICSMWDKLGWLNWFWQLLCEGLPYFSPKGFYYSYAWSRSLSRRKTVFCTGLIFRKLCRFLLMFLTSFTSLCLTSFSFIDHLLCLYSRFLILFHLT